MSGNRYLTGLLLSLVLVSGAPTSFSAAVDALLPVDCLLPGQVRRLGSMTYLSKRQALKTTAGECERRGGEYVAYDRANTASTLKIWLPLAEQGDPGAQTYVGEAYEKSDQGPDYASAAIWYTKAAEQGYARAAVNLGNLFAQGLGFNKDPKLARYWYQQASQSHTPSVEQAEEAAPLIEIVEPELVTRGGGLFMRKQRSLNSGELLIVGNVSNMERVARVEVNGRPAKLVGGTLFRAQIDTNQAKVDVVAFDPHNNTTSLSFQLGDRSAPVPAEPLPAIPSPPDDEADNKGRYFALVVGNNRYQSLPHLDTAINDAEVLAKLLQDHYGFETELLIDTNRYDLLSALNRLNKRFQPEDHLLIYYAGHGELDRINNRGHWLPVDAEPNSYANWVSNIAITDLLNIIPVRRLMVIADSCYSGMMSRSALGTLERQLSPKERARLLLSLSQRKSRTALTSGGVAPVIDGLGGGHSVFAAQLLKALQQNRDTLTGYELFRQVAPKVTAAAAGVGFEQTPEYAPLKFAGHEAGDFVFRRRSSQNDPTSSNNKESSSHVQRFTSTD
ncbi:hypothetical protein HBA55_11470 [Pseudomaricurvus alkylphenolicus]|uniref:caspase family protein n=1 Tax=Pseudomaricurvus alkylphenolicus TaxID=1306991 RepID=UPI0014236B8A|nr:hypothetical protein [Pseudomaricurvus alkylphenolicus]